MNLNSDNLDFNKTLAPWIGKTAKIINMYISDVFQQNNIQVTKEQWIVLRILHENKKPLIQNELAFITNRNKASLTRLINVMEKNNLVTRVSSKKDSRKKLIKINHKGTLLFLKMKPLMFKTLETMQHGITEDEKKIFINIITKIQTNLKNHTI